MRKTVKHEDWDVVEIFITLRGQFYGQERCIGCAKRTVRKQNDTPSNISGVMGHLLRGNNWPHGRRMRVAFLDIFTVSGGSSEGKHGGNFLVLTEQNGRAKRRKFS